MSNIKRIEKLENLLMAKDLDFLIIQDEISLFYLTGMHLSAGSLIIGKEAKRLFVDGRYIEAAQKQSFCSVLPLDSDSIADFLLVHAKEGRVKIAFDSNAFSYDSFTQLKTFLEKLEKQASKEILFQLIPVSSPLKEIRAIKMQEEISFLRKAAVINWKGFEFICSILKEGIAEKTLALEYELFCRQNGGEKLSFDPIISFGENSAMPHHKPGDRQLKANDIILIDIGISFANYQSDLSRVVFFGKPDPVLEKLYSIVKKAQNRALSMCKPGVHVGTIDQTVRDYLNQEGYLKDFLHSTGHGVGLEVHEFPRIKHDGKDKDATLLPGMVITVEPGIYHPGLGGVRYEDTILITKDGYENFYSAN